MYELLTCGLALSKVTKKYYFIIIHYFLLIVIAHSDGLILKETKWSLCHRIVKGAVLVAGYFVFESLIFPFIGITSSGIINGSTAESVYHFLVYNNGLILSKNSLADAFHSCWKVWIKSWNDFWT